jgi:SAM-dependent methyltransferase
MAPENSRKTLRFIKQTFHLVALSRWMNKGVRALSALSHRIQFLIEWSVDNPEYFDHEIDLHYSWSATRNSFPMERGVWSSFALKEGGSTLDLCCGDGFYSKMFYSLRSATVTAIDFDAEAIRWAKRNHSARNVTYILGDIRSDIPSGPFDNIVWDAAVAHFTPEEIKTLTDEVPRLYAQDRPENIREKGKTSVRTNFAAHMYSEPFAKLARHPRMIEPVEQMFVEKLYMHQFKPQQYMHQY